MPRPLEANDLCDAKEIVPTEKYLWFLLRPLMDMDKKKSGFFAHSCPFGAPILCARRSRRDLLLWKMYALHAFVGRNEMLEKYCSDYRNREHQRTRLSFTRISIKRPSLASELCTTKYYFHMRFSHDEQNSNEKSKKKNRLWKYIAFTLTRPSTLWASMRVQREKKNLLRPSSDRCSART